MSENFAKTKYPGVYTRDDSDGEKTFYIRYRLGGRDGKQIKEPVGKSSLGMTAAKANLIRANRIAGIEPPNAERRKKEAEIKSYEENRWTFDRLWEAYQEANPSETSNRKREIWLYRERIQKNFGKKTVDEITTIDLDRFKNKLLRDGAKPATVRNRMELIRRLLNFGAKQGYCVLPGALHFNFPRVDNEKTEVLSEEQLKRYDKALEEYESNRFLDEKIFYIAYARLIMHTGIRRKAAIALKWEDCDFQRGFITLRGENAKSGKTKSIPMSPYVHQLLSELPHDNGEFIFPQRHADTYTSYFRRVCDLAGIPKDFRPLHGLRHNFASRVASSGKVDLYTLQNLLTHSSSAMTQRYAHLADQAMHRAADVIDDVMTVSKDEDVIPTKQAS